jgi:thiol-disulfide isomerase/thioredoxin
MDVAAAVLSMSVTGGLIALVAALAVATVFGVTLQRRSGRFRPRSPGVSGFGPRSAAVGTGAAGTAAAGTGVAGSGANGSGADGLSEADLGATLGPRATLVQFSTAFCAPCRPTRQILAQVAGMVDGVAHVEIDATSRLDLVRRLRINSTPTVLVLDPDGAIVSRAVGAPRKADVIAALGRVITEPIATASTVNIGNLPAGGRDSQARPE